MADLNSVDEQELGAGDEDDMSHEFKYDPSSVKIELGNNSNSNDSEEEDNFTPKLLRKRSFIRNAQCQVKEESNSFSDEESFDEGGAESEGEYNPSPRKRKSSKTTPKKLPTQRQRQTARSKKIDDETPTAKKARKTERNVKRRQPKRPTQTKTESISLKSSKSNRKETFPKNAKQKKKTSTLTEEERQAYQEKNREKTRQWRANLPEEKKREMSQRSALQYLEKTSKMTEEEKTELRQKRALQQLEKKAQVGEEEVKKKRQEVSKKWYENMTPERKEKHLKNVKESGKKRLQRMKTEDPEKYEAYLKSFREYNRKQRLKKKAKLEEKNSSGEAKGKKVGKVFEPEMDGNDVKAREKHLSKLRSVKRGIRIKLQVQEMAKNGINPENVLCPRDTSEEKRIKRLLKMRIGVEKKKLRKQLEASGTPQEIIQQKIYELEENYVPKTEFKAYKPRQSFVETPVTEEEMRLLQGASGESESQIMPESSYGATFLAPQPNLQLPPFEFAHNFSAVPSPPEVPSPPHSGPYPEDDFNDNFEEDNESSFASSAAAPILFQFPTPGEHFLLKTEEGNKSESPVKSKPKASSNQTSTTSVNKGKTVICDECGRTLSVYSINAHKKTVHNPHYNNQRCLLCDLTFSKSQDFLLHYNREHLKIGRKVDGQIGKRKIKATVEVKKKPPPPQNRGNANAHICSSCGQIFKNEKTLKFHQFHQHGEGSFIENFLLCHLCDKRFKTKSLLESHLLHSHPETQTVPSSTKKSPKRVKNQCELCPEIIPKPEMDSHTKAKHPDSYFPCRFCENIRFSQVSLTFHEDQCATATPEQLKKLKEEWKSKGEPGSVANFKIKCEFCQFESSLRNLDNHYLKMHKLKEDKKNECPVCHLEFKSRPHFAVHLESIHKWKLEDALESCRAVLIQNRDKMEVFNMEGKRIIKKKASNRK